MQQIGPASELSAVNELLAAIGEDPVENVENLPPSGNTALAVLRRVARDFQEEGFWFNLEQDYTLSPDLFGTIALPLNILSVRGVDMDVTERGERLYNRETSSFVFSGPVDCEVILHLPWEELPPAARRYIAALATEQFVDGFPGAQAVTEASSRNLMRAKVAFERAVIRNGRYSLFSNSTIQTLTRRN